MAPRLLVQLVYVFACCFSAHASYGLYIVVSHRSARARMSHRLKFAAVPRNLQLLHQLGYATQEAAKQEFKYIGRNGPLPWASLFFLQTMPYINLLTLNTVPVAHLFLSGLVRTLLSYSLFSKKSRVPPNHPVMFQENQKSAVKVCQVSWVVVLFHT
jgi:hypothetical protein